MESGIGKIEHYQKFESLDIEIIENTSEEVLSAVIEMEARLQGTWQQNDEDDELQKRFWRLFKNSKLNGVLQARIGAQFLRQNRNLLE